MDPTPPPAIEEEAVRFRHARTVGFAGAIALDAGLTVAVAGVVGGVVDSLVDGRTSPTAIGMMAGGAGLAVAGDVALFGGALSASRQVGAPVGVGVVGLAVTAAGLVVAPTELGAGVALAVGGAALGGAQLAIAVHGGNQRGWTVAPTPHGIGVAATF